MVRTSLFVRLEAKPGKESAVAGFLSGALPLVESEPATVAWFALRMGPTTSGSLTRSTTSKDARHTSPERWRRRSWPRRASCSRLRLPSRSWKCWQTSYLMPTEPLSIPAQTI